MEYDSVQSIMANMRQIASKQKELAELVRSQVENISGAVKNTQAPEDLTGIGSKVKDTLNSAREEHARLRFQLDNLAEALYELWEAQE